MASLCLTQGLGSQGLGSLCLVANDDFFDLVSQPVASGYGEGSHTYSSSAHPWHVLSNLG